MKRLAFVLLTTLAFVFALPSWASTPKAGAGWLTMLLGDQGLNNWHVLGDANWRGEGGAIVADQGKGGFLVSKNAYKDFELYAEFWAASDTNSGIFIRAQDPKKIGADNAYEVNIWDIRPDPIYATGGIVNFSPVPVPTVYKAGGQWNRLEIRAKGNELMVIFNGVTTAHLRDGRFASGPFALQYGAGVKGATGGPIKWRLVQIKPL